MSNAGRYLYGFTDRNFDPPPGLCGLRGAPVRLVSFRDLAAVVSQHPVQRLLPSRSNVEPHHRVVRHVSAQAALVPAAFGASSIRITAMIGTGETATPTASGSRSPTT